MSRLRNFRKRIFGISPEETRCDRRGFRVSSEEARRRLEEAGRAFVTGYNSALAEDRPEPLAHVLQEVAPDCRGFAFEGAAMGLTLLDLLSPWRRRRFSAFLEGPGAAHAYMVHVGAGWAFARLHRRLAPALATMDPLLRWLVVDGYGFHQGYFHWRRHISDREVPKSIQGYAQRAFDQGIGRSLWFVEGADVARIPARIAGFDSGRQSDLWSGVGLATGYAGGVGRKELETLRAAADHYRSHLAQGAAFAAKARQRAGNLIPQTEMACEVFCGVSASEAAAWTDEALEGVPREPGGSEPGYEVWRQRLCARALEKGVA